MTTIKSPPPDPILDDNMQTHPMWRHWFNNLKMVAQTNITDASTSHAVDSWATTNSALDALASKINSILDILESIDAMEE